MVRLPWARSSRWRAGVPDGDDLYDLATMLPETTREAAQRFGERTAYVTADGWALTYQDLDRVSDEIASGLIARGITAGDVVALVLPPGPEYLLAYLGAAKVGAIIAGVNDRLAPVERAGVLDIARPRLVLATPGSAPTTSADVIEVSSGASIDDVLAPLRVAKGEPRLLPPDPERPVAIVFTSGTTGRPRGALYRNRQLAFITATDVGDTWGSGGRNISGTPFAHLGFTTKLPGSLRRGGTTFIMERWRAADALRLLAEHEVTTVAGVPTQLALMLREPDFDSYDLDHVGFIVVGGGPVTPGLAEEARARFGAALATRYSCTEAGIGLGTAFNDPEEDAVVSVGRPHPAVELAVLDGDDRPVRGTEAVGSVCLRSPAVMSEYWNNPEATAAAFTAGGFVRTGDAGWVDGRGRLRLVGRTKEMYVRGGYNVYPVEVEAALSTHPAVVAVAVAPRPDPVMGEVGVALVVVRGGEVPPTLTDLREHAAGQVAGYKLPDAVQVVDAIPLTAMEKVDRHALTGLVRTRNVPATGA
jgi:acyl-CoA synthetase (AMP-forming)/AMP-acid ligase II